MPHHHHPGHDHPDYDHDFEFHDYIGATSNFEHHHDVHHHHGDDGSLLIHNHDSNHDNGADDYDHYYEDNDYTLQPVYFGPADHDHDRTPQDRDQYSASELSRRSVARHRALVAERGVADREAWMT